MPVGAGEHASADPREPPSGRREGRTGAEGKGTTVVNTTRRCGRGITGTSTALLALLALVLFVGCSGTPDDGASENTAPAGQEPMANGDSADGARGADTGSGSRSPMSQTDAVDDIFDQMSLGEQERKQTAEFYLRQARKHFGESNYRSSAELYQKALEYDPSLEEAKEGLASSQMFLGRRDGEIRSVFEQLGEEIPVLEQARLAEVRQLLSEGRAALDEGRTDEALRAFTRARERLIWFEYGVDVTDLQEQAQALYDQARDAKIRLDATDQRRRQDSAAEVADRLRLEEDERRRERIATLIGTVQDSMVGKDYDNALQTAERILDLDPDNDVAKRLRAVANERLHAQQYTAYLDRDSEQVRKVWEDLERSAIPYEDEFNFPEDEDFWRQHVQRRSADLQTSSLDETPEIRKIRRALATVSPGFTFEEQSLQDVVAFLRTISDLNITIDPEIDAEEATVTLSLQNVKLGEALDLILKNTGLAYAFKENTLFITTPDKAFGNLIFDIYNVTDILNKIRDFPGPQIRVQSNDETDDSGGSSPFDFDAEEDDEEQLDPEMLKELIQESTGGEEAWDESGSVITPSKGTLLINATRELHLAVTSFLSNLRANSDVFVIVEARFIDMVDDFLEDIGVDSRNLGQPPGQGFGTAFGVLNSSRSGGTDIGFNNLGDPGNAQLVMGQDRTAGRIQHILDGFVGAAAGERLNASLRGMTLQVTWLDPFQINAIIRATQEQRSARTVTAPRVTASNGQRVHVSVITQRSYVQDYELVSGGTGLVVSEVADPVIDTFQDGVVLDVRPVISSDRKYITLDVRPTLASLINGIISTVTISLGTLNAAASLVEIDLPEISLQQAFTSVTVPDGGTVLLGGFRSLNERKYESTVPLLGKLPIIKNAFRRKAYLNEKRSLYILITAKVIDLRAEERDLFN